LGIGREAANHLLVLANSDTLALDGLDVFETRENFVVDGEKDLHLVFGAFLDGERVLAEGIEGARLCEINSDVGPTLNFLWPKLVVGQIDNDSRLTRARDLMMQVRGSLGSPMPVPPPRPSDCLYFRIASSSASVSQAEISMWS